MVKKIKRIWRDVVDTFGLYKWQYHVVLLLLIILAGIASGVETVATKVMTLVETKLVEPFVDVAAKGGKQ